MTIRLNRELKGLVLDHFGFALTRCVKQQQENSLTDFFRRVAPVATEHALIRVGNANDGGYLVPDDLHGIRTCFSPGVSDMVDFELALTQRGIRCFLADYSVATVPATNPLINFERRFLGSVDDDVFTTLESWVTRHADPDDNDLLLQMDIEGAEYDVLIDTPLELLRRFRVIVIEFHSMDALFTPMGFRLINGVFTKLLRAFKLVHAHPNNCYESQRYGRFRVPPVMEFTFHRADRVSSTSLARQFPHALDGTNEPDKRDFALPECWYASEPASVRPNFSK